MTACSPRALAAWLLANAWRLAAAYHGSPDRYFRIMNPDTPVVVCRACGRMFSEEDLEMEYLKKPECAFCR